MSKYSTGPFMNMSPAGFPGLLIVIVVVFGTVSLFVPQSYRSTLFIPFVAVVILVTAMGLYAQFRGASPEQQSSLFASAPSPADAPEQAEAPSERWRRYITVALVLIAAVSFTFFGLLTTMFEEEPPSHVWALAALGLLSSAGIAAQFVSLRRRHSKAAPPGAA